MRGAPSAVRWARRPPETRFWVLIRKDLFKSSFLQRPEIVKDARQEERHRGDRRLVDHAARLPLRQIDQQRARPPQVPSIFRAVQVTQRKLSAVGPGHKPNLL